MIENINDLQNKIKECLNLKTITFEKEVSSNYYFIVTDCKGNKGKIRYNEATKFLQEKVNGSWKMIMLKINL